MFIFLGEGTGFLWYIGFLDTRCRKVFRSASVSDGGWMAGLVFHLLTFFVVCTDFFVRIIFVGLPLYRIPFRLTNE